MVLLFVRVRSDRIHGISVPKDTPKSACHIPEIVQPRHHVISETLSQDTSQAPSKSTDILSLFHRDGADRHR